MNNDYLLSVAVAAAVHGALLFGFARNTRSAAASAKPGLPECELHVVELAPPHDRADEPAGASERKPGPDVRPPPRADQPPLARVDFETRPTLVLPPIAGVDSADLRKIPAMEPGMKSGTGGAPWPGIIPAVGLDKPPRTRLQVSPVYPFEARKHGMRGEVIVDFIVDSAGNVISPRIVRSSNRVFDEPTLRAVSRWKFEPGRRHGRIVSFRMMVPVVFDLDETGDLEIPKTL